MPVEENKAAIRKLWEVVYNQRKPEVMGAIATQEETEHVMRFYRVLTVAMPGLKVTILQMLGEGDLVADVVMFHGTQTGPLTIPGLSSPPTGKVFDVRMVNVWRLENGRISEHWGHWDVLGFMRTLGAAPGGPPPGPGPVGPPR